MSKSRKVSFQLPIYNELEIEVTASVSPGYPGHGPTYSCGGQPPEPPEVEDLYVAIIIDGVAIDISDRLDKLKPKTLDRIMDACIEQAEEVA